LPRCSAITGLPERVVASRIVARTTPAAEARGDGVTADRPAGGALIGPEDLPAAEPVVAEPVAADPVAAEPVDRVPTGADDVGEEAPGVHERSAAAPASAATALKPAPRRVTTSAGWTRAP
jgi:hypothetical protein